MFNKLIIFLLLPMTASAGLPPIQFNGLGDGLNNPISNFVKFKVIAPGATVTQTSTAAYIETLNYNQLLNASFENATPTTSWTVTNGSTTTDLNGIAGQSLRVTYAGTTGDIKQFNAASFSSLAGLNLESSCWVKTTLTTIQVCGLDSSGNEIGCANAPSDGNFHQVGINYSIATNTTPGVKVKTTSSATGSYNVDECYTGVARNFANVSQARSVGSLAWSPTPSCTWVTTQDTFAANFSNDNDCDDNARVVTGSITDATSGLRPAFGITGGAGDYLVVVQGSLGPNASGASTQQKANFRLFDGTNQYGGVQSVQIDNSASVTLVNYVPTLSFRWTQTTPLNGVTIDLQGNDGGATNGQAAVNGISSGLTFAVYYFPSGSQLVQTPGTTPGTWSGYHDATCSWARTNASLGDPTADSTCGFTQLQNTNFGTVTSALSGSDKLPGIVWTPVSANRCYLVTATTSVTGATLAAQIAVGLTFDNGVTWAGGTQSFRNPVANHSVPFPFVGTVCSTSTTAITAKLQTAASTGAVTIDSETTPTTQVITWTVTDLSQSFPAPLIANSVVSGSSGVIDTEFVAFGGNSALSSACTTGTCVSPAKSGGVSNVTFNATGKYNINFVAGTFSSAPVCTCNATSISANDFIAPFSYSSWTSTLAMVQVISTAGASTNDAAMCTCMGPK